MCTQQSEENLVHLPFLKSPVEWGLVTADLETETLKLKSYDAKLLQLIGNVNQKAILDYGAGAGNLAAALVKLNAKISVYDISDEMLNACRKIEGIEQIYPTLGEISKESFDFIICNLVLCIVPDHEVELIVKTISSLLRPTGKCYLGVCNPHIHNVKDSQLDEREYSGAKYSHNHNYNKVKKEGGYKIVERHRPLGWYDATFRALGFTPSGIHFTDSYDLEGQRIRDFVIFELERDSQI
jgi:SAM-dependent methyltransferase